MDTYDEQHRNQWNEAIARMAAQIDDFKGRVDSESQLLCTKLSAEMALLQSDLKNLEVEALGAGSDAYVRRLAKLIEQLRAQGEAAYELLQSTLPAHIDSTDVEIRQLEALAAGTRGDARTVITRRIDALKATRHFSKPNERSEPSSGQSNEKRHSPYG